MALSASQKEALVYLENGGVDTTWASDALQLVDAPRSYVQLVDRTFARALMDLYGIRQVDLSDIQASVSAIGDLLMNAPIILAPNQT